jgi:hypothetical protein
VARPIHLPAQSAAQQWVKNVTDFSTPVSYASGAEQFPYWWKDK